MKIIVTGGAGFIGSALCRHLINGTDAHVTVIDKLTYAANLNSLAPVAANSRYKFLQFDICSNVDLAAAFEQEQPDLVIHLAAETHVDRSISNSDAFIRTNIMGTYNLLEETRAYWSRMDHKDKAKFRFLHVSTDEVYGSLGASGAFSETTRFDPSSPYSASKAASDHLVSAWYRTHGLPTIISNCSNNFGPYQFPEKLIPLMVLNCLEGSPLPVYGNGSQVRDWLFVDDHVEAIVQIAAGGLPGETYNVGGSNERTNLEVVHAVCDVLDEIRPADSSFRNLIEFVADRPGHDQRYAVDSAKIERELGWRSKETFETGIRKTVEWYIANDDWWRPLRESVYGGERLGLMPTQEVQA